MDLTTPWLLPVGLLAVGALVVGTVVTGRRRVRVLASAGVLGRSAPPVPAGRWLSFSGVRPQSSMISTSDFSSFDRSRA